MIERTSGQSAEGCRRLSLMLGEPVHIAVHVAGKKRPKPVARLADSIRRRYADRVEPLGSRAAKQLGFQRQRCNSAGTFSNASR